MVNCFCGGVLAIGGAEGVTKVLQEFKTGVRNEAMLSGITTLRDIPSDAVVRTGGGA